MSRLTRRQLLQGGLAAGVAGCAGFGGKAIGQAIGANDAVRVAVIGLHGRGQSHLASIAHTEGMRLAGLCDVDPAILGQNVEAIEKHGSRVPAFADVRKLLDRKDVDAVTIATPNHWHSLLGVWACQAGKDVYVEKPVSHNIWEGRQFVRAARKYGRMVQSGTQARANPDVIDAVSWVRGGNLGKIRYAQGTCYNPRMSIGKVGKGKIPPGLDYDLWTGPAPLKPLARQNLHYDWHWIYDYGNGDLGNQGIHEMDIARWFLGYSALPPRVMSIGGRLGYDDDAETPNTQLVYHDYDGPPLVFEVRGLPKSSQYRTSKDVWSHNMDLPPGFVGPRGIGVTVVCDGGRLIVEGGGQAVVASDTAGKVMRRFEKKDRFGLGWIKGDRYIFRSWLQAMRSRKSEDLSADILEGHLSSALCHLGIISHRLGRTRTVGDIRQQIQGNRLAAARFESMKDHLQHNGVDLSRPQVTLGMWLTVDPAAERFVDNDAATALLRPPYRKPYVVPEMA
jgi:predicted dehydrogenase